MDHGRSGRRTAHLLVTVGALSLLSGCAAAEPGPGEPPQAAIARMRRDAASGDAAAYLTGRLAGQRGDLDLATDSFLRVLAHDPGNNELQQQAFLASLLAGRPEALRLAQSQAGNPLARLLLASADLRHGDWGAAETLYAGLPREGMTQILQPLLVAWAQAGSGRADAALATLHPFTESDRLHAVYRLHSALIADLGERDPEATRLYALTEADFPTPNLEVTRALASWRARHGDMAGANQLLDTLAGTSGDLAIVLPALRAHVADRGVRSAADGIAETYLALAAALRAQDANDVAALLVRLSLDLRPDLAGARLLSAEIDEQAHRPEAALRALDGLAADDPLAPLAALRRASLLQRMGRGDEALGILDRLAAALPDRPEPWAMRGALLREQHRYDEAAGAYAEAVARTREPGASSWPLFYERGIALERAHRWPEAEAAFERALALSPDQPSVLNYLGYSWTEQGRNLDRARGMIERAAALRPNDGAILDSLGWLLLREGDAKAAVNNLERATELEPEDATINGHLGDAYSAAHRQQEAAFQWRRALTLNPEPEEQTRIATRLRDAGEKLPAPEQPVAEQVPDTPASGETQGAEPAKP